MSLLAQKQLSYWTSVEASDSGMLGGFESVSRIDLQGSRTFVSKLALKPPPVTEAPVLRIADCGAGIGRITKGFLATLSPRSRVDIVEPVEKFTNVITNALNGDTAGEEAEGWKELNEKGRIGEVVNKGLEEWCPEKGAYWIIWNQWCLGHLTDEALVDYLRRCGRGIIKGGVVIVKENLTGCEEDVYDELDSAVTRSDTKFRKLFKEAGFKVVRTELQRGLLKGLYPVRSYALKVY